VADDESSAISADVYYRYQKEGQSNVAPAASSITHYQFTPIGLLRESFNLHNQKEPTELSSRIANIGIALFCRSMRISVRHRMQVRQIAGTNRMIHET